MKDLSLSDPEFSDFEFAGLLSFEDPIRPHVTESVEYCKKNNINVVMLTGDHLLTAKAIAQEIRLGGDHVNVIEATELKEEDLMNVDVVARCNPLQKLEIVNSLKKMGQIVAVTGDGVNDVPALKAANIGISMGLRGTKSAREISSIVLLDDNFSTIIEAIDEGKRLFSNLKLSYFYLFLIHIPFILTASLIPLFGFPVMYLPIHIILMELLIHPTMFFAFQMNQGFEDSFSQTFFKKNEIFEIAIISLLFTSILVFIFIRDFHQHEIVYARTKALNFFIFYNTFLIIYLTKFRNLISNLIATFFILFSIFIFLEAKVSQFLFLNFLPLKEWIIHFSILTLLFLFSFFIFRRRAT